MPSTDIHETENLQNNILVKQQNHQHLHHFSEVTLLKNKRIMYFNSSKIFKFLKYFSLF